MEVGVLSMTAHAAAVVSGISPPHETFVSLVDESMLSASTTVDGSARVGPDVSSAGGATMGGATERGATERGAMAVAEDELMLRRRPPRPVLGGCVPHAGPEM